MMLDVWASSHAWMTRDPVSAAKRLMSSKMVLPFVICAALVASLSCTQERLLHAGICPRPLYGSNLVRHAGTVMTILASSLLCVLSRSRQ